MLRSEQQREARQEAMRNRDREFATPIGDGRTQEKSWRENELIELLGLSRRTIRRIFENLPGVELIGNRRGIGGKRRYTMMLVPDSVLTRERERWRRR